MTKLIIVEGMDNTGKSTLINQYIQVRTALNPVVNIEVIHMEKPPQDVSKEELSAFQHKSYMRMVDRLKDLKQNKDCPDYIILDRAWISEYVYGPYYRNRDKSEIIIDNLVIEKKIMDIFGSDNVYLIFLYVNDLDFIKEKEDGKSLAVVNGHKLYPDYNYPILLGATPFPGEDPQKRKKDRNAYIEKSRIYEDNAFRHCFDNLTIIKNKLPIKAHLDKEKFDDSMIVQMFDFIHNQ